jgi:hypothetical protein
LQIQRLGNEMFLEKKIYEEKKKIPHAHYQTATPKLKI